MDLLPLGADSGELANYGWGVNDAASTVALTGRFGGQAIRVAPGDYAYRAFTMSGSTVILGAAFRVLGLPVSGAQVDLVDFQWGEGNPGIIIRLTETGALQLVDRTGTVVASTAAGTVSAGRYYRIEVKVASIGGTADVDVWLGDSTAWTQIFNESSVDAASGSTSYGSVYLRAGPANAADWDDVLLLDGSGTRANDVVGDVRAATLAPTSDGGLMEWTPSTGTDGYAMVDDPAPGGPVDTDYIQAAAAPLEARFGLESLPSSASAVHMVAVSSRMQDGGGANNAAALINSDGSETTGTSRSLSSAFLSYQDYFDEDPNGDEAWTQTSVERLEIGVRMTTVADYGRVSRLTAEVWYTEQGAATVLSESGGNFLRELLGPIDLRVDDGGDYEERRHTLHLKGRAASEDFGAVRNELAVGLGVESVITPTALSADVNDYNPTGFALASVALLQASGATRNVTGFEASGLVENIKLVLNLGAQDIVLKHQDAGSAVANRMYIAGGADLTLGTYQSAWLYYDPISTVWWVTPRRALSPLLSWYAATFSNGDDDRLFFYAPGNVEVGPFAANVPAILTVNGVRFLQIFSARTNVLTRSEEIDVDGSGAPWFHDTGVTSVTADDAAAPDGAVTAENVEFNTGASEWLYQELAAAGFSDNINFCLSIAHKNGPTGNGQFRIQSRNKAGTLDSSIFAAGASWARDQLSTTTGTGATNPRFYLRNGTTITVREIYFARAQLEGTTQDTFYAGPPIRTGTTAKTRTADICWYDTPPPGLLNGKWSVDVMPDWTSSDVQGLETHYIFYIDANNNLAITETGGQVQVVWKTSGGNVVRTLTLASRQMIITITVDFTTGDLTIAGATTGNGTTNGTVGNWSGSRVYIGMSSTPSQRFDGAIAEPRLAA